MSMPTVKPRGAPERQVKPGDFILLRRTDSWAATRFGLARYARREVISPVEVAGQKARCYSTGPLDPPDIPRLAEFLNEQGIPHVFKPKAE